LRSTDFVPGEEQKQLFLNAAAAVREDGYLVIERKVGFSMDDAEYNSDVATSVAELPIRVLTGLSEDRPYSIAAIMAPVHDEKGRASFALGLTGFYSTMSAARVRHAGGQLRDACARVSDFIAGRDAQARPA
jgi:hypothetical protein